jgi:hypothetical protein
MTAVAAPGDRWWGTGRMPTKTVGPERALTWAGEPVNTEAEGLANRRGTLDTIAVNGPEDVLDGDAILARPRGQRSPVAVADLHGDAAAGLGHGPVAAELSRDAWGLA